MCGIAGIIGGEERQIVDSMCDALQSRGPDDAGSVHGTNVSLGMRRLSIVDPSGGNQPISNEDETIWTVCNGEIYNYQSLRRELRERGHRFSTDVDVEVIVHGYEEWGKQVVERINGMYAFAIWDTAKNRVVLSRDRLGIKPLYYVTTGNTVIFASELTALLEHPDVEPKICEEAIRRYWAFQYVPAPWSIISGIRKLEPATTATIPLEDVRVRTERYWSLDVERSSHESVRRLLESSVERRLMADVPLGAFLSGGVDSTTVVALMNELTSNPVRTYSVGFADTEYDESSFSRRVAEDLGTAHSEFTFRREDMDVFDEVVTQLDEPFADPAIIPTYLLADYASDDVKTVLTGEGSDELFAGYDYYREYANRWNTLGDLPTPVYQIAKRLEAAVPSGTKPDRYLQALSSHESQCSAFTSYLMPEWEPYHWRAFADSVDAASIRETIEYCVAEAFSSDDFRRNVLRFDQRYWLPDDLLFKVDRMTMANSLEARVPFLDHRLVERVNGVPTGEHYRNGTKPVLRNEIRDIVPGYVLKRKKQGFIVPLDDWFSEPRDEIDAVFDEQALAQIPFVNQEATVSLLDRHRSGTVDTSWELWRILIYAAWYRHHIQPRRE